jgi:D-serine deaminase-like pyridoxal phosphate-dependent protein
MIWSLPCYVAGVRAGGHFTDGQVDWRAKGVLWPGAPVADEDFAAAGYSLFDGPFTWPVLVARRSAIAHNVRTLAEFCDRHGLAFAPHGKTTMAPALFRTQLAAGAWGITVATANQAMVCRAAGVDRVFVADEILDPRALRWLGSEDFQTVHYVDSLEGVAAIVEAAPARTLDVVVEWGFTGGRTGCRDLRTAIAVATAAADAPGARLVGVSGYEGMLPGPDAVRSYLDSLRSTTIALTHEWLLPDQVIVSAGGSAYFDLVADALSGDWLPGHTVVPLLRSGAYITHDNGTYERMTPFNRIPAEGGLEAALELWAQVLSTPEPGLAIVGMGKRDAPFDEGFPVPLAVRRDGVLEGLQGARCTRLNDQHAYLTVEEGSVKPGDLIRFGISHPCTAFDRWRLIPLVDDEHVVTGLLRTYF